MARRAQIVRVTAALAVAAVTVCLVFAWRWLRQTSEMEQLLDILAGENLPNAAWALERLRAIRDEDLRMLVRHLTDGRRTPLDPPYAEDGTDWRPGGDLTLGHVVRSILLARTPFASKTAFGIVRIADYPESWNGERWSTELERWLSQQRERSAATASPSPRMWAWRKALPVRPPTFPPAFFSEMTPDHAAQVAGVLRGDDKALAAWMVETLRRSSDAIVDALAPLVRSMDPTQVTFFYFKGDSVARRQGFALGPLVQLLLAERLQDDVLYYNCRRAAQDWFWLDSAKLADRVEAAWKEHEGHRR